LVPVRQACRGAYRREFNPVLYRRVRAPAQAVPLAYRARLQRLQDGGRAEADSRGRKAAAVVVVGPEPTIEFSMRSKDRKVGIRAQSPIRKIILAISNGDRLQKRTVQQVRVVVGTQSFLLIKPGAQRSQRCCKAKAKGSRFSKSADGMRRDRKVEHTGPLPWQSSRVSVPAMCHSQAPGNKVRHLRPGQ